MNDATSSLQALVQQGWAEHERDPAGVLERLQAAPSLVQGEADLPGVTGLIVHVAGEHLGRWADGLTLLDRLGALPAAAPSTPGGQALLRARAALALCAGDASGAERDLAAGHPVGLPLGSTRARVLAVAASALAGQGRISEALAWFEEALGAADYGPEAADPAARALAVTGNNLACALETRPARGAGEDRLLELAARTARRYWEVAGTWSNVQIAEYRLGMTYLALRRPEDALRHARLCLELCQAHQAGPGDLLFAWEVLARALSAAGDAAGAAGAREQAEAAFAGVDEDLRAAARQTLDALVAALA